MVFFLFFAARIAVTVDPGEDRGTASDGDRGRGNDGGAESSSSVWRGVEEEGVMPAAACSLASWASWYSNVVTSTNFLEKRKASKLKHIRRNEEMTN